mmetsp:Transcript_792/g.1858  ORF Transcript_792/g.1858 Transcript_792/m.1858 type:complete len:237 (+) Transcript_792:212-922(+)|eukprot:CAMPEP_0197589780 /NCGR_PEP_ID=MMETSP1326-20131121/10601_1 /TAXON_ID=1155430 /ORGANISM="Genus nov. species nov., Strain RCC2288" /LENGTH=236 /DNA_ID=CAMNT_0043154755 /DNA_START=221 /DNA_END=931 /DNA_ORIENTATION=+
MIKASGHEHVPLHDGAGGKKMMGRKAVEPSPFAVMDPREELVAASKSKAKGHMPSSSRPWGREEDMNAAPESDGLGGKAMGAFHPKTTTEAPFALDPRKAGAAPPGVFGDAWAGGDHAAFSIPLPSVNQNAPFGTDFTPAEAPSPNSKPWLQQKPAPWNNPNNEHDNVKSGRRIIDARPGESAPLTKDAKTVLREELKEHMEAQIADRKHAKAEYVNGGVGARPVGQMPLSKTRPW